MSDEKKENPQQSQADQAKANADADAKLKASLDASVPKIRSKVGSQDLSVEDEKIAEYKRTCEDTIREIDKEWEKRIQARRGQGADAPSDLERMYKIIFMGSPFPFLNDIDLIVKKWFYKDKLETLSDDKVKLSDKISAMDSIDNFSIVSNSAKGLLDQAGQKLDEYGMAGKGLKYLGKGVGYVSDLVGASSLLSGAADIIGGTVLNAFPSLKGAKPLPELVSGQYKKEQQPQQNVDVDDDDDNQLHINH